MTLCLTSLHEGVEVKFVGVTFAMDLGHYVLVVIVTKGSKRETKIVVVTVVL